MTDVANFQFYQARPRSQISLTPLIDVVFILLLFFMLASNFNVETSLSLQSADNQAENSASTEPPSRLRILNADSYLLDGSALDSTALVIALAERHASDPAHALSVSVADGIRVQELLDLIALAEKIGLNRVTVESSIP